MQENAATAQLKEAEGAARMHDIQRVQYVRQDAYASGARRLDRGEDPRDPRASRPAARPVRPSGDDGYAARPAARPVSRPAARPEGGVRTDRPARPAEDSAARRPAAPARKQPAKNFADDDFDYDFLKLDDKDE